MPDSTQSPDENKQRLAPSRDRKMVTETLPSPLAYIPVNIFLSIELFFATAAGGTLPAKAPAALKRVRNGTDRRSPTPPPLASRARPGPQPLRRQVQLQPHQELVGRLVIVAARQAAKIGLADVDCCAICCRPVNRLKFAQCAAGSDRKWHRRASGRLPKSKAIRRSSKSDTPARRAQTSAVSRSVSPVADQVVEDPLDFARYEDPAAGPRRQTVLPQQPGGPAAREIDEVNYQPVVAIGDDAVWRVRPVAEHAARQ